MTEAGHIIITIDLVGEQYPRFSSRVGVSANRTTFANALLLRQVPETVLSPTDYARPRHKFKLK